MKTDLRFGWNRHLAASRRRGAQTDVRAKLENAGLEVIGNSPQEFAAQIWDEIVRKGTLVKIVRVKPE